MKNFRVRLLLNGGLAVYKNDMIINMFSKISLKQPNYIL